MSPSPGAPEQKAREQIDASLIAAGWMVQDRDEMNLSAGRGVAVREFKLTTGHGFADYLLFVDGKAVGVLEAKPEGHTLSGVEVQTEKYSTGLPAGLNPPVEPLPFLSLSKWAFEGKLTDQDPSDEPASVLLERIRTETAARMASDTSGASPKRRGRRGTMTGTKHKK